MMNINPNMMMSSTAPPPLLSTSSHFLLSPAISNIPTPTLAPTTTTTATTDHAFSKASRAVSIMNDLDRSRSYIIGLEDVKQQNILCDNIFRALGHRIALPKLITDSIASVIVQSNQNDDGSEPVYRMGLFPDIYRAWITINNQFFIWNFLDGGDVIALDHEFGETLVSVGLVRPKPNIFKSNVSYLLVFATLTDVSLFTVVIESFRFQDFSNKGYRSNESSSGDMGHLVIVPTNYSVSTDGVNMLKIAGLQKNGRIFMCGDNGSLYELTYEVDEDWLRRKCRKLNHSQSFMGALIPSFLRFSSTEAIVDIVIDHDLMRLYTLSENSLIEVYTLGEDGTQMVKMATYSTFARDMKQVAQYNYSASTSYIVSIMPVPASESRQAQLVAVTSTGYRLLFSVLESYNVSDSKLVIVGRRQSDLMLDQNAINQIQYSRCFYNRGVFIMTGRLTPNQTSDTMIGSSIESQCTSNQGIILNEYYRSFSLTERAIVHAVGEVPVMDIVPQPEKPFVGPCASFPSVCRQFVVLTNRGVFLYEKSRPVDLLVSEAYVQNCRPEDIFALTLSYLVEQSVSDVDSLREMRECVLQEAKKTRIELTQNHAQIINIERVGFYLYFLGLMKPLWPSLIFKTVGNGEESVLTPRFNREELEYARRSLLTLTAIIDRYQLLRKSDLPTGEQYNPANEEQSIDDLNTIVKRTLDTLSFLETITLPDNNGFQSIAPNDPIAKLSFESIVVRYDSQITVKKLASLVATSLGQKEFSDYIQKLQVVKELFSITDIHEITAQYKLLSSQACPIEKKKKELIEQSFTEFMSIAGSIDIVAMCECFYKVGEPEKAVRLALEGVKKYLDINKTMSDQSQQIAIYSEERRSCYEWINKVLRDESISPAVRKSIQALVRECKDELLHRCIYEECQKQRDISLLLQINSPYNEALLQNDRGLLYEYYIRTEQTERAARVLNESNTQIQMNLQERIAYLTKTLFNAKTKTDRTGLQALQDELDVANLQQEALKELSELHPSKTQAIEEMKNCVLNMESIWERIREHGLVMSNVLVLYWTNNSGLVVYQAYERLIDSLIANNLVLLQKLQTLYHMLKNTPFFPVDLICAALIVKTRLDVHLFLKSIGISSHRIYFAYKNIVKQLDVPSNALAKKEESLRSISPEAKEIDRLMSYLSPEENQNLFRCMVQVALACLETEKDKLPIEEMTFLETKIQEELPEDTDLLHAVKKAKLLLEHNNIL